MIFTKGPQFYAEINFRFFFLLLFSRVNLLVSNDLDTLPSCYLASIIRGIPHVHDCHEYFRGVPELNNRPFPMKAWKWIEDRIFPHLRSVYAVNGSIARIYQEEYCVSVHVIRNVPVKKENMEVVSKSKLGIPDPNKVILYQGAVNIDRGLEEAIDAMNHVTIPATLLILGTGDIFDKLKKKVDEMGLGNKVIMTGAIPLEQLHSYTLMGDIGISIEKDVSLNYHYCLPNKFLDYIQAGIPVLVSPLPEMKAIVDQYQIGEFIKDHDPLKLAEEFESMLKNQSRLDYYRKNLVNAAADLCWENEEKELIRIYAPYV